MRVSQVIFIGQPALPTSLQEQIAGSLGTNGYDDDEEGMDELLGRIRDAWQEQGYFNSKVELSGTQIVDETEETRTLAVIVDVIAGKKYRLGDISFEFTIDNPARRSRTTLDKGEVQGQFSKSDLRALFPIKEGDVFDTHKIQQGLEALRKAYGARGFINFSPLPITEVDETNDRITVKLDIDEGIQFHVGHIELAGLDASIADRLLAESGIVTGNVFDSSRPEEFRKQVRALLSADFTPGDVERRLDGELGTVDLTFYLYPCRAPQPFVFY
jgi:outer membrane protein insertion porin family